jgi:nucleoid-associated protein Lsr2
MAQQVSVLLLCDLHGGDVEAVETVSFGVGNTAYEIDVCAADAKELRSKLEPFIEHARRRSGGQQRRPGRRAADRAHTAEIRAWAKEQGHQISERGRIPASVVAEYEQSH